MGQDPSPHAGAPDPRRGSRVVARQPERVVGSRKKGGNAIGPDPTDRGTPGTKRHMMVDRRGLPLAVVLTGANRHDSMALTTAVDAIHPVRQRRGRPHKRPDKLHADKGYDFDRCRKDLHKRAIMPRIARRGIDSSTHLGKHRWGGGERTFAWINPFRHLAIRYECHADLYRAFLVFAAAIIGFRAISRFCEALQASGSSTQRPLPPLLAHQTAPAGLCWLLKITLSHGPLRPTPPPRSDQHQKCLMPKISDQAALEGSFRAS